MLRLERSTNTPCELDETGRHRHTERIADVPIIGPIANNGCSPTYPVSLNGEHLNDEALIVCGELDATCVEQEFARLDDPRHQRNSLLTSCRVIGTKLPPSHLKVVGRGVIEGLRPEDEILRHEVTCMKIWYTSASVSATVFRLPSTTFAC